MKSLTFVIWLDSLGWPAVVCFFVSIGVVSIVLILLIDAGALRFALWLERRAIRRRRWEDRRRQQGSFTSCLHCEKPNCRARWEVNQWICDCGFPRLTSSDMRYIASPEFPRPAPRIPRWPRHVPTRAN